MNLSKDKVPYIGYKLLCLLNKFGVVKSVWSTNFDGLVPRAAHQLNITPIEINLDNEGHIFRNSSDSELLYIALHGDYKYSKFNFYNPLRRINMKYTFKKLSKFIIYLLISFFYIIF
jgi:hypothetical protein